MDTITAPLDLAALGPFADPRALDFLTLFAAAAGRGGRPGSEVAGMVSRLVAATRSQLGRASHIDSPARALQRASEHQMWGDFWSCEAEACAWRGAGIYLDFALSIIAALAPEDPADPWHWLLEPGVRVPRRRQARYSVLQGRPGLLISGIPLTADRALDEVRRWKGCGRSVRAELDLAASLAA